jgi:hypothetical protein
VELSFSDVMKRLALWTAVCSLSAAPSFLWAMGEFDRGAMLLAVACFIGIMTALTCTRRFERFKRRAYVRKTLYIGYGTRVAISLVVPLGMAIDVYPGLFSVMLAEQLAPPDTFVGTFVATMIQGTLLNVLISLLMLVVYAALRLIGGPPLPTGSCADCGYDLRGSAGSGVCPECGTSFAPPVAPA